MNWSGGYKHRFRPNGSEIRKTAFQQQSRIVLVDLVKNDDDTLKQISHIPKNNVQMFPLISPKMKVSHDDIPVQNFGIPFHNIPCGSSSSDTEEYGNEELSNTNYSPYSLDQETTAEHHISSISGGNLVNNPSSYIADEYYEDSNPNEVILPQKSSHSGFSSLISENSSVECLTPPPYLNTNAYFLTPTPVKNPEFTAGHSINNGHVFQPGVAHNSNVRHLPYPTSLTIKTVNEKQTVFETVPTESRKTRSTTNCSIFVPVNITPVQRKQVHFYSSDQEISTVENRASSSVTEQYDNYGVNTPRNKHALTAVGSFSTPAKPYHGNFNYPTPRLDSFTPTIHREEFSAIKSNQRIFELKDVTSHNIQSPTSVKIDTKKTVFQTTHNTSKADHNPDLKQDQNERSIFPSLMVTPLQRKQVQFAAPVPLQKIKVVVNNTAVPHKETSNLDTPMPCISFKNNGSSMDWLECQTSTSSTDEKERSAVITEEIVSAKYESCNLGETICLVQSSSEIGATCTPLSPTSSQERITNTNENLDKQAKPKNTSKKRKQCDAPGKIAASHKKKLYRRCMQYCRCRTIIRKVKIRDAQTQTSP